LQASQSFGATGDLPGEGAQSYQIGDFHRWKSLIIIYGMQSA